MGWNINFTAQCKNIAFHQAEFKQNLWNSFVLKKIIGQKGLEFASIKFLKIKKII